MLKVLSDFDLPFNTTWETSDWLWLNFSALAPNMDRKKSLDEVQMGEETVKILTL